MLRPVKITSKWRATIPKAIRDILKSDVVEFEVVDGSVVLKPVRSVAGSLKRYSRGYVLLKDVREKICSQPVHPVS